MENKYTHGGPVEVTEIYFYAGGEVVFKTGDATTAFESLKPFTATITEEGITCDYN